MTDDIAVPDETEEPPIDEPERPLPVDDPDPSDGSTDEGVEP